MSKTGEWATKVLAVIKSGNTDAAIAQIKVAPTVKDLKALKTLMIMGKRWIKPGAYGQYAEVVDIAPTLAHLLQVRPPAGAEGRVLTETLR